MRIYTVRHGVTDWNNEGIMQGHADIPLNAEGHEQAARLAEWFSSFPVDAVYSSDLRRAGATAEGIARKKGLDVIYDIKLREIDVGSWQGRKWDEVSAEWNEYLKTIRETHETNCSTPGESYEELQERMRKAFDEVIEKGHKNVVFVSHGAALRVLFCSLFGMNISRRNFFEVDNTSVSIFDYFPEDKRLRVCGLNLTEHLRI